jgi:hypothetical protein
MTEKEIEKIVDKADFVVSGYAFTERDDGFISILNLIQKRGTLSDHELNVIQKFIKQNYEDMYKTWKEFGGGDFFEN